MKTPGREYAPGHHPASHVDSPGLREAISKGRKLYFENGGTSWWTGKHHKKSTKKKIGRNTSKWQREHREEFRKVMRESDAHYFASMKGVRAAAEVNKGRPKPGQLKFLRGRKCWYPSKDQKEICMRSSWEVAFACWLDNCNIRWEYEARTFYLGSGPWKGVTYTPDFYLPDQKQYVEIKGYYSAANKRRMERFQELYPDVQLYMFFGQHLKHAKVIPFKKAV